MNLFTMRFSETNRNYNSGHKYLLELSYALCSVNKDGLMPGGIITSTTPNILAFTSHNRQQGEAEGLGLGAPRLPDLQSVSTPTAPADDRPACLIRPSHLGVPMCGLRCSENLKKWKIVLAHAGSHGGGHFQPFEKKQCKIE